MADAPPDGWQELERSGIPLAAERLERFLGLPVRLTTPRFQVLSWSEVIRHCGGAEKEVVAIHAAFQGELTGQVVFLLDQSDAAFLVSAVLGEVPLLDELARSLLAEVGNIATATLLAVLADHLGGRIRPTPPMTIHDLQGAVLGSILPLVADGDDAILLLETDLSLAEARLTGHLLVFPDRQSYPAASRQGKP